MCGRRKRCQLLIVYILIASNAKRCLGGLFTMSNECQWVGNPGLDSRLDRVPTDLQNDGFAVVGFVETWRLGPLERGFS